ncbi:MAG: 16S rRNA (guanine(966)-N(2))-methyltransferase RsmD [Pseudohongiellaceae bacterium]|jgi:16S rRNA (guanine966-N2)-methyltransferase
MTKPANHSARNRLRIIGGDWRSRVLQFAEVPDIRPTPDRIRETLFNWLQFEITGARCLDLFAGSGALGFEALSRGAAHVTAFEQNRAAAQGIRANCTRLDTRKLELVETNAMDQLQHVSAPAPFDIAFVDPPFASDFYEPCFRHLQERGWLASGALVYAEAAQPLTAFALPTGWQLQREKRAGDVYYGLFRAALAGAGV